MSNALAIAGVTAVLKDLIDTGLIDHQVVDAMGAGVTVSSLPPDRVPLEGSDAVPRINLFLHQVSPNTAWRNVDLPSRNNDGRRTGSPPLPLDLHYLLSAYGFDELQAEVLLGYALQMLHQNPVLDRAQIRAALNPSPVSGALLPTVFQGLRSADLAEQAELLKISLTNMAGEEMSRLWSALQARYRPTVAFTVSVVLIEAQQPAVSPLPVLRRGERDQGPIVTPGMVPPYPTLDSAIAPAHRTPGVLRLGDTVQLAGHHLGGTARRLVLRSDRFGVAHEIPLADGVGETSIGFSMPITPAALPAGLYRAELQVLRAGEPRPRTSNALPLAIAPAITSFPPLAIARDASNRLSITLAVAPAVRVGQTVTLSMDTREAPAQARATDSDPLVFVFADAPPVGGTPLLRLRVDGIESVHVDRNGSPPGFFDHRITLPA
ncbi:conserved hypothetical protein [Burkholderiales bacterium 8X]|nr:conserved hypothetical protein [Burkholderiales bacterium 8X]